MSLNNLGLGFTFAATDTSKSVMDGVKTNLEGVEHAAGHAAERGHETGEAMERVGLGMAAAGAGALAFLGVATAKAYEFEEALKAVRAETTEAAFPMEAMGEQAHKLAIEFGTLPIEQAKAMFLAVQQGAHSAAESEDLLTAANRLAKVGHVDLGAAIQTTTQLLRSYSLGFDHSAEVSDKLFAASLQAKVSVGDLGSTLAHVAPDAARLGVSLDELLGSLGAMSSAGLSGRPAVEGLRGVIQAFIEPSKDAAGEAARLGIAFSEQAVKAKGLVPVLESIANNPHFNKATLQKLFGSVEVGTAALALMHNNGEALAQSVAAIGGSLGALAKQSDALVTPQERFRALTAAALELVGKALLPLIDAAASVGNTLLAAFNGMAEPLRQLLVAGVALGAAFLIVAGTVIGAAGAMLAFDAAASPAIAALALALPILGYVALGLAAVSAAVYVAYRAFEANFGGIRDTVETAYEKIRVFWGALVQVFTQGGFSGSVLKDLDKAGNEGIQPFVIKIYVWAKRIEHFFTALGEGFSAAMAIMGPALHDLMDAFAEVGDALAKAFGGPNDPAANAAAITTMAGAGGTLGRVLGGLVDTVLVPLIGVLASLVHTIAFVTDHWAIFKAGLIVASGPIGWAIWAVATLAAKFDLLGPAAKTAILVALGPLGLLIAGIEKAVDLIDKARYAGETDEQHKARVERESPENRARWAAMQERAHVAQAQRTQLATAQRERATELGAGASQRLQGGESGKAAEHDRQLLDTMQHILAQLKTNGGQPINVHLDGEKIAEGVGKRQDEAGARGFNARPLPG